MDRPRHEEEGAALVEYGMLVDLIAVICVVAGTNKTCSTIASARPVSSQQLRYMVGRARSQRSTVHVSFGGHGREP